MTQPKLYGEPVAARVPEWVVQGLDRMAEKGQTRSDVIRKVLAQAVLNAETEE